MSSSVLPMFFSKRFIVSGLTFRSLIHFEFIFVYDVRNYFNLILFHVAVQFSPLQYSCLENPMDGGAGRLQSMGSLRVGHD